MWRCLIAWHPVCIACGMLVTGNLACNVLNTAPPWLHNRSRNFQEPSRTASSVIQLIACRVSRYQHMLFTPGARLSGTATFEWIFLSLSIQYILWFFAMRFFFCHFHSPIWGCIHYKSCQRKILSRGLPTRASDHARNSWSIPKDECTSMRGTWSEHKTNGALAV